MKQPALEIQITNCPSAEQDDSTIVDRFVQALLMDARAHTPWLLYTQQDDVTFVCQSFGISKTRIVLQQQRKTNYSDQYKVSLEYLDGTEVIACTESAKSDIESSLRELYSLISQQHSEADKDTAVKDAEYFISMMYQKHLRPQSVRDDVDIDTLAHPAILLIATLLVDH